MNYFLCLIFLLFKCLLIVLALQRASTIDFNLVDVDIFFVLHKQFFSWVVLIIFLACLSVFLFHTYLDFSNDCKSRFYCVLGPSKFLSVFAEKLITKILSRYVTKWVSSFHKVPLTIPHTPISVTMLGSHWYKIHQQHIWIYHMNFHPVNFQLIHTHTHTHIYIYIERERERVSRREWKEYW